jgi:hypothetical protein
MVNNPERTVLVKDHAAYRRIETIESTKHNWVFQKCTVADQNKLHCTMAACVKPTRE